MRGLNKRLVRKNTFYCAEFVRYVLKKSGVDTSKLPDSIKPESFKEMSELKLIYKGLLRNYNTNKKDIIKYLEASISEKRISV